MKKLFGLLSVLMILALFLLVPNQDVFAKVVVTYPEVTAVLLGPPICERVWTSGSVSHIRDCVFQMAYSSDDDFRLVGINTLTMNQNIFDELGFPAVGHGSWVLEAELVGGGYWAGTYTANIDETGYMTVYIRGKGYGTLEGLQLDSITHGIGGADIVTITTLPSYDGPEP
jgi:hypothetical protein